MSSNPYQSPQSFGQPNYSGYPSGPGGEDREKTRDVARYQRMVMYALLANLGLNIGAIAIQSATRGQGGLAVAFAILAAALAIAIFSIVAMFLLANSLHNPVVGVLCAILMVVPCLSLITLLVINQQATSFLKSRGVRVGFLGADPNSI